MIFDTAGSVNRSALYFGIMAKRSQKYIMPAILFGENRGMVK
jgi:hypothetical protein